ncbi:MAG: ATP-binding cassette domain-containing protein [bacterium]
MLKVINLKKVFTNEKMFGKGKTEVIAVAGVSFEVKDGTIMAIVGESGSGKTTIARCLAGIEIPDEGEIIFNNEPLMFDTKEKRAAVQYVFQDTFGSLNPRMKIGDIIAEPIGFHFNKTGNELRLGVIACLESVGLKTEIENKYPHELSGGQRQRVVIARALAMRPSLLIADEPVSSLDVSVQAQILSLFQKLNKENKISIVFITHDLRLVKSLADDIIVLKDGKIEEQGSVENVFCKPKSAYTKLLLSSIPGNPQK